MKKTLFLLLFLSFISKTIAQQGFSAGNDKKINCLTPSVVLAGKIPSKSYSFYWTGPKSFYSEELQPSVTEVGTYTLFAHDTFLNKTYTSSVEVINDKIKLIANAGVDQKLTCLFPEAVLDIENPGVGFSVFIVGPDKFMANKLPVLVTKTGTYVLEVFKGVCSAFDTVKVESQKVLPKPNAGVDLLLNCKNPTAKLQAVFPGKEINLEWFFNGKIISNQLQPFVNQVGTYILKTSQGTCENRDTIIVNGDFRKPILTGANEYSLNCAPPYCVKTSFKCLYEKESTFLWNDNKGTGFSTILPQNLCETGVYTLRSKLEKNGCEDEIKIRVSNSDSLKFLATVDKGCENTSNGAIHIKEVKNGTSPFQYSLNNVDFQKDIHFENLKMGEYRIFVKDAKGCKGNQKITVAPRQKFDWAIEEEYTFCSHDKPLEINATVSDPDAGAVHYVWSDGGNEAIKKFVKSDNVWVEAHGECFTEKKNIQLKDKFDEIRTAAIYVPNIFYPNSKNADNQAFKAFPAFPMTEYELNIFTSNGQKIFTTNDTTQSWDGTFQGRNVSSGTYLWQVVAKLNACNSNIPFQESGSINLIR
jgi:gliding motility-associated-like protein